MASSVGWAALKVIPTVEGVAKEVSSQVVAPLKAGGEKAGKEMAGGIADGLKQAESKVKAATQAQVKAMATVEDQSSKVRVAELKLQELRDSGKAKASQIEAAEAKITTERRKLNEVVGQAEAAEKHLADARDAATEAAKDSTKATDKLSDSHGDAAKAAKDEADELEKLEKEAKKTEQASEDLEAVQGKLAIGFAAAAAAAIGVGAALVGIGGQFDDMYDTIRIGTGASGEAFEALQQNARNVAGAIPAMDGGFEQIGSTMADLNTRLGATGPELEELTSQFLQLQNMGVEADISSVTGALSAFGIEAADQSVAVDDLFRAQQATGVSMTELSDSMIKAGPSIREMGYSFDEAVGLVGALDKAGLDAAGTMGALSKGMGGFAKEGEPAAESMRRLILETQDLQNAGKDAEAQALAMGAVGPKQFLPFLEAVKGGKLTTDDMAAAIGVSSDSILELAAETADGAEQWQMFKQKAMLAVEPLATALFDKLTPALETAGEWFEKILGFVKDNETAFTAFAVVLGGMAIGFGTYTIAMKAWTVATRLAAVAQLVLDGTFKASGVGLIVTLVAGLVAGIIYLATQTQFFQKTWEIVWGAIKKAFEVVWNFIKNNWQTILAVLTGPIGIAVLMITKNWDKISAAFQAVWDFVKNITQIFVDWVVGAWNGFISFFTELPGKITAVASTMWDSVKTSVTSAKDWVVDKFNAVLSFFTEMPGKIASATSGMWDGIKNAFRDALNWLIGKWNNFSLGFDFKIPVINKEISFRVNTPDIPLLAGGGIAGRTDSGQLYGPGTGTSDSILGVDDYGMPTALVSAKERVMSLASRGRGDNDAIQTAMNAGASFDLSGLQRLKDGGPVGREPYGLPVGTNTGGFGSSGNAFPEWVHTIEDEHAVKASTYPGHQERSGLNKGIDWVGSISEMQSFADFLLGIGDQLEQVIWANPQTGQKIGIADGVPVGPGTDQPGYYSSDWGGHQDHVHTRQSYSFGAVEATPPAPSSESLSYGDSGTTSSASSAETAAPAEPQKAFSARDRYKSMFTDFGNIAADASMEIFGLGEWLDLADRYTIVDADAAAPSLSPGTAESTQAESDAIVQSAPIIPESLEVQRHGAELYAYEIARVAKDMGLGAKGALIGEATAIVEAGNPLKMWANSKLPASLDFPHDAVGNNGTSTGLFQQQDFPEWGSLEQRMDPTASAKMFYEHFPAGWESMDPGKVAQGVQRSSLPGRYGQEMGAAQKLLDTTGLFDTGGVWEPGTLGFNGLDEPEYVLKDAHWKVAERSIDKVDELVGAGVGGPQRVINQTFHTTVADQREFQRTANRDRDLAMMQHGGRP